MVSIHAVKDSSLKLHVCAKLDRLSDVTHFRLNLPHPSPSLHVVTQLVTPPKMTSQTTTPSTWCLYHKDCFLHDIPVRTTAVVQKSQVTGSFHRSAQCYSRCQFVVSKNNRLFRHIVFRAYSSSKETKNDHPLYTQRKRDKRENQTLSNCQTCDVIQGSNLLPIVARRLKSLNYPPLPA